MERVIQLLAHPFARTALLVAVSTGVFALVGWMIGGSVGALIALLLAGAFHFGVWRYADTLALKMSGARPIDAAEAPELYSVVSRLATRAGLAPPRLYLIRSVAPNAFATGRRADRSAIAVTTGLLRLLDHEELAGVIAHELAHIKRKDTILPSAVAIVGGSVHWMAQGLRRVFVPDGLERVPTRRSGAFAGIVRSAVLLLVAPIAALLFRVAVAQEREYRADADGAALLGNPLPLASALEKIEWASRRLPMRINPAAAHLYIVNPLRGGLFDILPTHPRTDARVTRLRALALEQLTSGAIVPAQETIRI
jgi:heat shock protein HtpX